MAEGPGAVRPLRLVRDGEDPGRQDEGRLSFDDFFRRHHRLVATIGLRILGRASEVDDFVQDVFLDAHRGYHRIRDHRAAKGWLRSIAVRTAMRRIRRRRFVAALGFDRREDAESLPIEASQEQAVLLGQVYRALESVPTKARVVWILRTIEGEKLEDIAVMTGMGLSSVKRHLTAASALLEGVLRE
jgi:RNA polymerase sigma-70 factor, ECF subfamily